MFVFSTDLVLGVPIRAVSVREQGILVVVIGRITHPDHEPDQSPDQ